MGTVASRRRPIARCWSGSPRTSATARRTASVCTGAFLLAAAGVLDGRRATTHWASAGELAARYPGVDVDPEPIFLRDGPIWTSAGVTAGMDLALALVEEDLDRDAALQIARHLVLFLRRPGNQSQFSATLSAQEPAREPLREVQRHVVEHPEADLSVEALADRACMSPRHFARAFAAESGVTPARYVERVRLEAARRRLEDTAEPIAAVARRLRLRHRGDDAPHVPARARRRTGGVPPPLLCPDRKGDSAMNIAILLFDRLAALDAVGPYEVLSRLPGAKVTFVAEQAGPKRHRHRTAGAHGRRIARGTGPPRGRARSRRPRPGRR